MSSHDSFLPGTIQVLPSFSWAGPSAASSSPRKNACESTTTIYIINTYVSMCVCNMDMKQPCICMHLYAFVYTSRDKLMNIMCIYNLYMYAYIYMCIYIYVYTHTHTRFIHICEEMNRYLYIHIYIILLPHSASNHRIASTKRISSRGFWIQRPAVPHPTRLLVHLSKTILAAGRDDPMTPEGPEVRTWRIYTSLLTFPWRRRYGGWF